MPQTSNGTQQRNFAGKVRKAFARRRDEIKSVSALARALDRPRTSVSRSIHHGIFPKLKNEIRGALGI